jgi:hypothetical protein
MATNGGGDSGAGRWSARSIRQATVVSAVSTGIAERLGELYRLPAPAIVVRNIPHFEAIAFRPTAPDRIRVLYHGIVAAGRGLEAMIDSVAAWRPEFELTIRGPGERDYLAALRRQIAERGLSDRVAMAPPVPMTALVCEAAAMILASSRSREAPGITNSPCRISSSNM